MKRLLLMLCLSLIGGGSMAESLSNVKDLQAREEWPELMRFSDGRKVETLSDWQARRKELLQLYGHYMYGYMPDAAEEELSYAIDRAKSKMTVTVRHGGEEASFTVLLTLPEKAEQPVPCFIEYMWKMGGTFAPSPNAQIAAARGYAAISYDPLEVAMDNNLHLGAYYTLYPYSIWPKDQNGVLLSWAWGVSKVIDALEQGAGKELGIDPAMCMVAGVSRFGKSAAVAGAYDERIRVTIPACSGAGGVAVYRTDNHGKTYDLRSLGGEENWRNTSINEPFDNLRGGEGYWFCQNFRLMKGVEYLPVEQYMLCALAAGADRHMIIVTGITSEGWNNTEGQCLAYTASQPVWDLLGAGDQNNMIIHLDGHAILPSDMQYILDYCDVHLLGKKDVKSDLRQMKGNLFLVENRDRLGEEFDLFQPQIDSILRYAD